MAHTPPDASTFAAWFDTVQRTLRPVGEHVLAGLVHDPVVLAFPALILLAGLIEGLCVGWSASTFAHWRQTRRIDWFFYGVKQLNLGVAIGHVFTLLAIYFAYRGVTALFGPSLGWMELTPANYVLFVLAVDLSGYWFHRWSHEWSALWALHHVHHSAERLHLLAGFRSHPAEDALSKLFMTLPLAIVFHVQPEPLFALLVAHQGFAKLLNLLQHSQISSTWGVVGEWLVSPAAHKVHHSRAPEHFNSNYGHSFIVWDKLFGTHVRIDAAQAAQVRVGLDDYDPTKGIWRYLIDCARCSLGHVFRRHPTP